jgi:hypothetical protein
LKLWLSIVKLKLQRQEKNKMTPEVWQNLSPEVIGDPYLLSSGSGGRGKSWDLVRSGLK